jgi:hypothetical protein
MNQSFNISPHHHAGDTIALTGKARLSGFVPLSLMLIIMLLTSTLTGAT